MTTKTPVISIGNLTKTYEMGEVSVQACGLFLSNIHAGEFVTVVGPSGSGKSTLMHIWVAWTNRTSGQYFLAGKDVSHLSDDEISAVRNNKIGFVFQGFNLLTRTSAV